MPTIGAKQNRDDAQNQSLSVRSRDQEKRVLWLQKTFHASVSSHLLIFKGHSGRNHLKSKLKEEAVAKGRCHFPWILQSIYLPLLPGHHTCEKGGMFGWPETPGLPKLEKKKDSAAHASWGSNHPGRILKKFLPLVRHKALISKQVILPNSLEVSLLFSNPRWGWGKELMQLPLKSYPPWIFRKNCSLYHQAHPNIDIISFMCLLTTLLISWSKQDKYKIWSLLVPWGH